MEIGQSLSGQIYQLEDQLLKPEVRQSKEKIAILLADEFVEFGSSGRIWTKPQVIEEFQHSPMISMTIQDFQLKVLSPEVVLATYCTITKNVTKGDQRYSLRSSLWKFINGRWQMIFHQGTKIQ